MKKTVLSLSVFVLIMFVVTACAAATPVATPAPAQPAATEPQPQASPTEAGAAASGTQVDVTLADNTIHASMTNFQVGVPYTFVITNTGRHAHNFNINTPVSAAGSLDNALASALVKVDQQQLGAGANVAVEYTFPESAVGQSLEFSCLIRRHYEDGMFLPITVTQ